MDPSRPVLIVFHGAAGTGTAERMVTAVRAAAARQAATVALAAGFGAVIFATDDPALAAGIRAERVIVDGDGGMPAAFDFDVRLRDIVARYRLQRPVVMGSGSLPLAAERDYRAVFEALAGDGPALVTNNFYSSDLAGWTPGSALSRLARVPRDNALPRQLRDEAGFDAIVLPRSTRTLFDIDTPADVAVLAQATAPLGSPSMFRSQGLGAGTGDPGPEALRFAVEAAITESLGPVLPRYSAVMETLCDARSELLVAGRVGSGAWQYLETETACRVRLLSEERGLAAAGREHAARSVLGYLIEAVGVSGFFERVCTLGDAVVIDTRVIEAHLGVTPSREDRFQSDLLNAGAIEDPFLRDFTAAARDAPRPVLLGGHSLVSGGLMALADAAWREHDATRKLSRGRTGRRSPAAGSAG